MKQGISKGLNTTFLIHAIVSVIFGAAAWIIPGRSLVLLGWLPATVQVPGTELSAPGTVFVDPILTRLFGAALLALAFSSFQGWRASRWEEVELLVQLEALYCVLSVIGIVATWILNPAVMNFTRWGILLLITIFAVAWIVALWRHRVESAVPTEPTAA